MSQLPYALGWIPDTPDIHDCTPDSNSVPYRPMKSGEAKPVSYLLDQANAKRPEHLPDTVDLRQWCSPVEDQQSIGSCTANAGVGMIEYFENRAFGKHINASRLFLYKTTRNILHWTGDTGAYLRTTMGALAIFGVPPEEYWPYDISLFDKEPSPFCYAFGQSYQAITYFRLDPSDLPKNTVLNQIKKNLAAGISSVFGFTVYNSIEQAAATGKIPFPAKRDKAVGGHAVMAAGYDDDIVIGNGESQTKGAILIRNSWGTSWGTNGYGWLPYDYVLKGLAIDWWSLIKSEWIDTGNFKIED